MEQKVAVNLNSSETIEVCLPDEVSCGEFEVALGESATIEIPVALNYIKSGEVEIKKYVNETLVPELDLYESNAREYAEQAEVSAEKAKESQETAAVSEVNALASEASAEMFKDLANESATNAKTSEDNALLSEQNAKTSETNAKISEQNAFNSAEEAKQYGGVIATEQEAIEGVNDTHVMTPLKTAQAIDDKTGKFVQLGFNAYLEGGSLVFEPTDNEVYDIRQNYSYNIDLLFEAVGDLPDSTTMVIKNGDSTYNIVSVNHTDPTVPMTVGEMKQLETYTIDIGYRWLFDVKFTKTTGGENALIMLSTVVNPTFSENISRRWSDNLASKTQNWQGTAITTQTDDGTISSIINARNTTDLTTEQTLRQYALGDMTKFAGITNSVKDDGVSRLSYEVANGTNTNLTEYSADSSNTDVALKGWVLKNATNIEKTNCLTEIPQDIKLELNDGTLTLKAGSKVYIPNGFEADGTTPKFAVVTIKSDIICEGYQTAESRLMMYLNNNVYGGANDFVYSGNTSTMNSKTPYVYAYFYNTQTNKMYTGNGNSWNEVLLSLPLGLATSNSSSQYDSLDQTFNGFGYIGSTVFALPGVKGLMPDGRNEDGTLRNIEVTSTKVIAKNYTTTGGDWVVGLYSSSFGLFKLTYDSDTNKNSANDIVQAVANVGNISLLNGTITSFTPKTTFHAVDRNDSSWLSGLGMPSSRYIDLTLGASGSSYTAPANGFVLFRRTPTAAGQYLQVSNGTRSGIQIFMQSGGTSNVVGGYIPVQKGDAFQVAYTLGSTTNQVFRFIYAQGETI